MTPPDKIQSLKIHDPKKLGRTPAPATEDPLLDAATRKAAALWRDGKQDLSPDQIFDFGEGVPPQWIPSICNCGLKDSAPYRRVTIRGEAVGMAPTIVHRLAHHRTEVDPEWVKRFADLEIDGVDPTLEECPRPVRTAASPPVRR